MSIPFGAASSRKWLLACSRDARLKGSPAAQQILAGPKIFAKPVFPCREKPFSPVTKLTQPNPIMER
jgi:hypothetical protein